MIISYVCAEYNYGGIPEWVPLHKPNMAMRRLNPDWMQAMETYVKSTIDYLADNQLFGYQGGPIVMAQIENELGEEEEGNNEEDFDNIPNMDDDMPPPTGTAKDDPHERVLRANTMTENDDDGDDDNSNIDRNADGNDNDDHGTTVVEKVSVQDYADWCGSLVARLAPNVIWTMCNGLSAQNTIITCNGDCSTKWLEDHGSSGRIQVDQPAMWSEGTKAFLKGMLPFLCTFCTL